MLELLNYFKNDEIIVIIFWEYNKKLYIKNNRIERYNEYELSNKRIKKWDEERDIGY